MSTTISMPLMLNHVGSDENSLASKIADYLLTLATEEE